MKITRPYNLFLDDIRNPTSVVYTKLPSVSWITVRNYDEFVGVISQFGLPDIISFDHDLGLEHYNVVDLSGKTKIDYAKFKEKTGYDCALWLIEYCIKSSSGLPEFYCHSMNPVGKNNILSLLNQFKQRTSI